MTDTDAPSAPQDPHPPRPGRAPTFFGRLSQAVQRQDWFAVCLEVLIVIAGVLIALAANDWAGARQARQVEVESLRALSAALTNDLVDIRENVHNHTNAGEGAALLREHIREDGPYSDTLDVHFAYLFTPSWSLRDLAAYETLKQRGMETVTNDSLRASIGYLYGYRYEAALGSQALAYGFVTDQVAPYMDDHFRDYRLLENWTPISYDEVASSPRFLSLLDRSAALHGFVAQQMSYMETRVVALIADLDAEVARLE